MKFAKPRYRLWFAALLPFVGVSAMVAQSEVALHVGPGFRIPIRGYDPRDLFYGQYLRYQFDFDWEGQGSCGGSEVAVGIGVNHPLAVGCCLCLTRGSADGNNPKVRQIRCDDAEPTCDGLIRTSDIAPPLRYFIPEDRAQELENAMRTRRPSIALTLPRQGKPAIKELYLDDRPWREALGKK